MFANHTYLAYTNKVFKVETYYAYYAEKDYYIRFYRISRKIYISRPIAHVPSKSTPSIIVFLFYLLNIS